jgi:hypothetical protein
MAILLVSINGYFINDLWWLFYWCLLVIILLMVIILMDINSYAIGGVI